MFDEVAASSEQRRGIEITCRLRHRALLLHASDKSNPTNHRDHLTRCQELLVSDLQSIGIGLGGVAPRNGDLGAMHLLEAVLQHGSIDLVEQFELMRTS